MKLHLFMLLIVVSAKDFILNEVEFILDFESWL